MTFSTIGAPDPPLDWKSVPLSFTVLGPPVAKERPRTVVHAGKVHTYTPERTRNYESLINRIALSAIALRHQKLRESCRDTGDPDHQWPLDAYYKLTVDFYLPNRRHADLDNLCKSMCDGLNGVAWSDDSRVIRIEASRGLDARRPRADVLVQVVPSPYPAVLVKRSRKRASTA